MFFSRFWRKKANNTMSEIDERNNDLLKRNKNILNLIKKYNNDNMNMNIINNDDRRKTLKNKTQLKNIHNRQYRRISEKIKKQNDIEEILKKISQKTNKLTDSEKKILLNQLNSGLKNQLDKYMNLTVKELINLIQYKIKRNSINKKQGTEAAANQLQALPFSLLPTSARSSSNNPRNQPAAAANQQQKNLQPSRKMKTDKQNVRTNPYRRRRSSSNNPRGNQSPAAAKKLPAAAKKLQAARQLNEFFSSSLVKKN